MEPAVTHYTVLKRIEYVSLMECRQTGRTHQIRVHMKHIGHPLFNARFMEAIKFCAEQLFQNTNNLCKIVLNCSLDKRCMLKHSGLNIH